MRPRSLPALILALSMLAAGCQALGIRATVEEDQARDLLTQAVGLAASGQVDRLCTLSPAEASTCEDSLDTAGNVVPDTGPRVVCAVPAPTTGPLRGGQVLVVEGVDSVGDPYTTEFIVYDSGQGIGVLDAVFWSGLSVVSYAEDTVAWRFDSASRTCDRGGLPGPEDLRVTPAPREDDVRQDGGREDGGRDEGLPDDRVPEAASTPRVRPLEPLSEEP